MEVEADRHRNRRNDRMMGEVSFDNDTYSVQIKRYSTNRHVRIEKQFKDQDNELIYTNTFNGANIDIPEGTEEAVEHFFSLAREDSENWNLGKDEIIYIGDREIQNI